jgi:hypothetical protein
MYCTFEQVEDISQPRQKLLPLVTARRCCFPSTGLLVGRPGRQTFGLRFCSHIELTFLMRTARTVMNSLAQGQRGITPIQLLMRQATFFGERTRGVETRVRRKRSANRKRPAMVAGLQPGTCLNHGLQLTTSFLVTKLPESV